MSEWIVEKTFLPGVGFAGVGEGCSSLISWSNFFDSFSSSFLIASLVSAPCPMYWLHTTVSPFLSARTTCVLLVMLAPFAAHCAKITKKNAVNQKFHCVILVNGWTALQYFSKIPFNRINQTVWGCLTYWPEIWLVGRLENFPVGLLSK